MANVESSYAHASATQSVWDNSPYIPQLGEIIIRSGVAYQGDGVTRGAVLPTSRVLVGATGATGPTGPTGPQGPAGAAGTGTAVTKLSATAPIPAGTPAGFIIRTPAV